MNSAVAPFLSTPDMLLWSAATGAIALVVLLALADVAFSRTLAALQTFAYLVAFWLFVALLSGWMATLLPALQPVLPTAQLIIGPLCAAMGSYGCSQWLSARKRDRTMKVSLQTITWACLLGGPLCLLLPQPWRLPGAAALSVGNMAVVLWLSVRAAQLGDRRAWGLAIACMLSLPMQIGLYGMALGGMRTSRWLQAAIALLGLVSVLVTTAILWLRNRDTRQLSDSRLSRRDPITQLYSGTVIIQKIVEAQRRRLRTRRDGALLVVLVFEPERLLSQVGQNGLNDIYIQLSHRMQRHTGVVNPAGRYYDCCFVVLLETLHSPRWMRTVGLRVASSLRRPLEVISLAGSPMSISADIAVGIVHLSADVKDVDQLLHEAQEVAEAARGMRSRAALLDRETQQAVPVESAELGGSWRSMRALGAVQEQEQVSQFEGRRSRPLPKLKATRRNRAA